MPKMQGGKAQFKSRFVDEFLDGGGELIKTASPRRERQFMKTLAQHAGVEPGLRFRFLVGVLFDLFFQIKIA